MTTYGIVIAGQSNEEGAAAYTSGGISVANISPFGFPNNDFLGDGSKGANEWAGRASMWPLLSTLLAKRGHRALFFNAAVGGTGQVHNWTGMVKKWSTDWGYVAKLNTKCIPTTPNGYVYECTSTGAWSVTTEPTWPTTIGATVAESASGGAVWTCARAAEAYDVHNHVYRAGESGYDPRGLISALKARISAMPTVDQLWVFAAGNQSDVFQGSWSPTAAQRAEAIINMADDLMATYPRLNIALGMTCYWAGAGTDAYDNVLEASLNSALAHYEGNNRVIRGGDLYLGLGTSPIYTSGETPEDIHIGVESTISAAKVWYDALIKSGRF